MTENHTRVDQEVHLVEVTTLIEKEKEAGTEAETATIFLHLQLLQVQEEAHTLGLLPVGLRRAIRRLHLLHQGQVHLSRRIIDQEHSHLHLVQEAVDHLEISFHRQVLYEAEHL